MKATLGCAVFSRGWKLRLEQQMLSCTLTDLIFGVLKRITESPINTSSQLHLFIFYKLEDVVNTPTRYRLEIPGSNSNGGEVFLTRPHRS